MSNTQNAMADLFGAQTGMPAGGTGESTVLRWDQIAAMGEQASTAMDNTSTSTLIDEGTCIFRIEEGTIRDGVKCSDGIYRPRGVAIKFHVMINVDKQARVERDYTQTFYIRNKEAGDSHYGMSQLNAIMFNALAQIENTTLANITNTANQLLASTNPEDRAKVSVETMLGQITGAVLAMPITIRPGQDGRPPQNNLRTDTIVPVKRDQLDAIMGILEQKEAEAEQPAQTAELPQEQPGEPQRMGAEFNTQ